MFGPFTKLFAAVARLAASVNAIADTADEANAQLRRRLGMAGADPLALPMPATPPAALPADNSGEAQDAAQVPATAEAPAPTKTGRRGRGAAAMA